MAKSNRGGKRTPTNISNPAPSATPLSQQQQNQIQQDVQQNDVQNNLMYATFMSMNDDGKAQVISDMMIQGVPAHLADNDLQKFIYNLGLDEKPTLVDDNVLDSMFGTDLFRTVDYVSDSRSITGKGYTAPQIAAQFMKGTNTRVSDSGGSRHGRGFYFANSYNGSVSYGSHRNINSTTVMRAKLNSNAKSISERAINNMLSTEMSSGSKLGKVLSKCDYDSRTSLLALAKGYNVITCSNGYHVVLNRGALTMSKDIKSPSNKWK